MDHITENVLIQAFAASLCKGYLEGAKTVGVT